MFCLIYPPIDNDEFTTDLLRARTSNLVLITKLVPNLKPLSLDKFISFVSSALLIFCYHFLFLDGASLLYVSAKINKNCDLLYKYLVHRIYGLKFDTPALVVGKDAVFIPSGWDSDKKISIL